MSADQGSLQAFTQTKLSFPPRLLRASAGSGKTYELSTRLIALLLAGESVDRILATTFTRKAAAEILDRLILRLAKAGISNKDSAELGQSLGMEILTPERVLDCLERVADQFNRINICTLDSWFFQIRQVFPLELGIDPGAGILDIDEREQLLSRAIGMTLSRLNREDRNETILLLNRGSYASGIVAKLKREIIPASTVFRYLPESIWNWIEVDESRRKLLLEQAQIELAKVEPPRTKSKGNPPNKHWAAALEKTRSELAHGRSAGLAESKFVRSFVDGSMSYYGVALPTESLPAFKALSDLISIDIETGLKRENSSVGKLMTAIYKEFDLLLSGEKKIGFEELKLYLIDATFSDRAADIYYRLDRCISHLLLDEFQDTSLFEWKILYPFVDEILSKSGEEASFFCVGDVKQAIYGWRGGCSALFNTIKDTWPQLNPEARDLSYRSTKAVIDTVNRIFSSIAENPALAGQRHAAHKWGEDFKLHSTSRDSEPGYVELRLIGTIDPEEPAADQRFVAACRKIEKLYSANPKKSIGVLFRTNKDVSKLLYYLSRLCPSIPASEEGGNPLTDSLPVTVMLSLLKIIDHPGDLISRYHVAASPLGSLLNYTGFFDDQETKRIFDGLRREVYESGIGPLLSRLVQQIAAANTITSYDHQRLVRLVELGYQFDRRAGDRIFNFIAYVKRCKVADSAAAPVRVMTIHGSKGLEFDAVILPDLGRELIQLEKSRFLIDLPVGSGRPARASAYRSAKQRIFSPQLTQFFDGLADDALMSELCNLYVATTRARDQLVLLAPERDEYKDGYKGKDEKGPTFDRILFHALGGPEQSPEPDRLVYSAGDESTWPENPDSAAEIGSGIRSAPPESGRTAETPALMQSTGQNNRSYSHETPSERAAESGNRGNIVRRIFDKRDIAAMSFGSLVHRGFEQIEWFEGNVPAQSDLVQAMIGTAAGPDPEVEKAAAAVARSLSADEIRSIFNRKRYFAGGIDRVEAFREQPFSYATGKSIVSGSIDRLVVTFSAGNPVSATVIDFKTDSIAGDSSQDSIARLRDRYAPQISDYITAAAHLTGLDRTKIQAVLVLTSICKVVPMEMVSDCIKIPE